MRRSYTSIAMNTVMLVAAPRAVVLATTTTSTTATTTTTLHVGDAIQIMNAHRHLGWVYQPPQLSDPYEKSGKGSDYYRYYYWDYHTPSTSYGGGGGKGSKTGKTGKGGKSNSKSTHSKGDAGAGGGGTSWSAAVSTHYYHHDGNHQQLKEQHDHPVKEPVRYHYYWPYPDPEPDTPSTLYSSYGTTSSSSSNSSKGSKGASSKSSKYSKGCGLSKGSKSKSKSGKSSKGSGWTEEEEEEENCGKWAYVMHNWVNDDDNDHDHHRPAVVVTPRPNKPDSSSPGICGPSPYQGGLMCNNMDMEFEYCTHPGRDAECNQRQPHHGYTCYNKELCPAYATHHGHPSPVGVCGVHGDSERGGDGGGLECTEVTTYCSEPGRHAECGVDRMCYDANLCRFGEDGGDYNIVYDGVCVLPPSSSSSSHITTTTKRKEWWGYDCDAVVTTKCTTPGEVAECAYGAKCYDVAHCEQQGVVTVVVEMENPPTSPSDVPTPMLPSNPTKPPKMTLNMVCITKGKLVNCPSSSSSSSSWGDDGFGPGIAVPFTYTVDTDGKALPEDVLLPMENAILDDVTETIQRDEKYATFSGKLSAAPEDYIAVDDWCGDGHAIRCSVVKGEITFFPLVSGVEDVSNPCLITEIIETSMNGNDYTRIEGVTDAKYRNSDLESCSDGIVSSAATTAAITDEDLSTGALFAIWCAVLALIGLVFLLARRRRRRAPPVGRDDISLISNDLNGSVYEFDDPYANTTDVHKCTSKVCPICNTRPQDPQFLPVLGGEVNMGKIQEAHGICVPASNTAVSPTSVKEVGSDFDMDRLVDKETKEEELEDHVPPPPPLPASQGSIMRVPYFHAHSDQPLPPVNEMAHESDETELESVVDDSDNSTVPPPPPLPFHPAYQQRNNKQRDDDEESV